MFNSGPGGLSPVQWSLASDTKEVQKWQNARQGTVTRLLPMCCLSVAADWAAHPELLPSISVISRIVKTFPFSALSSSLTISDVT